MRINVRNVGRQKIGLTGNRRPAARFKHQDLEAAFGASQRRRQACRPGADNADIERSVRVGGSCERQWSTPLSGMSVAPVP